MHYRNTRRRRKDITSVNIYAPNIRIPKFIKQTLTDLKREIDSKIITEGNLDIPHSTMDRSSRQKNQ